MQINLDMSFLFRIFVSKKNIMRRIEVNPHTLLISVPEVIDMIEQDIVNNASEIFGRQEYYTRKYRGDLLNDVNVGIFLDDDLRMAVQIYASNGKSALRTKMKLSQNLRRISNSEIINKKNMIIVKTLPVYSETPFDVRLKELTDELVANHPDFVLEDIQKDYPVDGEFVLQFRFL